MHVDDSSLLGSRRRVGMAEGIQASPLAKKGVSASGTARSWRTVTKLLELADEGAA